MIVAYACDLNVYMCVNFGDEILLRGGGGGCKNLGKFEFFQKMENDKLLLQYKLQNWIFFFLISDDKADLTVGFVSQNLVTQTNFI